MLDKYPRFIRPTIFDVFSEEVVAAQTTRHGGVSLLPFMSLNLGNFTEDSAENIHQNRRLVLTELGFSEANFTFVKQVHGDNILYTIQAECKDGYDAIISDKRGLMIGVTVADCTPILIYDTKHRAVAAIHAGWKGTVELLVKKTILRMSEVFGTVASDCYAYIGPCIDECNFEVGDEVAAQFDAQFLTFYEEKQKYHVNLKQANKQQLIDEGVPLEQIEVSPYSTVLDNEHFFSYRAEGGQTGRLMALIGLR